MTPSSCRMFTTYPEMISSHLTRDVKITETSKGLFVLKGTIADNYGWSNKDEGQNKVNWINFTRFLRKQPTEGFVQRLQKGAFFLNKTYIQTLLIYE